MSGKQPFLVSPHDDVDVYEGKFSDLILTRIKQQNGGNVLIVDQKTKLSITAEEILTKSVRLAKALRKLGVKEGDVICVVSENSLNYFLPVLAGLYLGSVISPVNPSYSIGELTHSFGLVRPKIVFCSESALSNAIRVKQRSDFVGKIIALGATDQDVEDLDAILASVGDVGDFRTNENFSDDNTAFVLCSSGTTGLPKGVMITYDSLRYHMLYITLEQYVNINPKAVTLGVIPFFHIFGLFVQLFGILTGMKSVLVAKFSPEVYLRAVEEHKATKLFIVPLLAQFLARSPLVDDFDLGSVDDLICGGAPLHDQTIKDLKTRFNFKLRQIYGLTETGGVTVGDSKREDKLGTVGVLAPKVRGRVRQVESGKILGPNEHGELCFKGPTVMMGYFGNPQSTMDAFDEEGYLLTGDIGYYDEDGYFFIVDRHKDLIKYKGFQVPPFELETILLAHPSVAEAAVIGVPDERSGEVPLAVVVKKPNAEVTEQELIDLVAEQVSPLKHLHGGVKFTDHLPKTPNGKVMKRLLKNAYKSS